MAHDDTPDDIGSLLDWWRKKKPDDPAPAPQPDAPPPRYLKVLMAMRNIPIQKLGPLLFTVPVLVFLAISGAVAWLAVGLGVVLRIARLVSGL